MDNMISLSNLEDQLVLDTDGNYKLEVIGKINNELTALKKIKNSGLSPMEYKKNEKVIAALDECIKVIEITWFRHHKGNQKVSP